MVANENFNLNLQNDEEEFVVDFGETTNLGGGGGTTNFNELTHRPKYDNITMTGGTNIPKVPTKTSELTNDANFATKTEVGAAVETESLARESADTAINGAIANETTARQNADNGLQSQIDAIVASSDVKDIVGTYADLQAYDTSTLGNNDIIKVLQDETHSNETTYYRWSTSTSSFSLIGEEGPYYTKAQTDTLLNGKQNILTAGNNIQISGDTISATDTTYTAGNNVDITNGVISATDTTYSDFIGTDGTAAGQDGLVPAPATTDAGKFLKADGTWATAGGGGGQNIIELTSSDYNYPTTNPIAVGLWLKDAGVYYAKNGVEVRSTTNKYHSGGIFIVSDADSTNKEIAFIDNDNSRLHWLRVDNTGSVYIAEKIAAVTNDVVNNLTTTASGKILDARQGKSLKTLIDSLVFQNAGAPTTSTVGTVGQLLEDTTNGDLYICTDATNPYVWEEVGGGGGGGPTVVQTTGTSTTDVMSQNAVTSMVFADSSDTTDKIRIGNSNPIGTFSISIGGSATQAMGAQRATNIGGGSSASASGSTAVGNNASVSSSYTGSVALGAYARPGSSGQVYIGSSQTQYGYNGSSNYRLLSGLYDGQSAHDAVTVGQVNAVIDAINTALSTNIPHIGASS